MATLQFSQGEENPPKILHRNKQLLNNIVDGLAKTRPSAPYAEIPVSLDKYNAGYRGVSYSDLANAVNGVAWWLSEKLGAPGNDQTLAYIGPNDLGYVVMILGAVKAGYKLLLVSPRNSISDHLSLFEATQCQILLAPLEPRSPLVPAISSARPLQVLDSPLLVELLAQDYPHYPYVKTFEEARNEPLLVVHTSGTTAVPKPVVYSHDFVASNIQWGQLEPPKGYESQASLCQSNRFFVTLPFFHAGNLFATLFDAIANQTTVITPLAGVPPSAEVIIEGLKHIQVDVLCLAPPFVEQIAKNLPMLDFVTGHVKTVVYAGGDISQWSGDALASRVRLFNFNGSTETGSFPLLRLTGQYPSEDWKYICPHPAAGLEFRPSVHGLYEAFIVRNTSFEDEQPVFKIFPDLTEYPTKDLWAPHPSKDGLWAYRGRADDTILFKPGYMCDPTTMEQRIALHPKVGAVVMAGTDRFQPALIIERTDDQSSSPVREQNLTEELWPLIQEANQLYKLGARVNKSHIIYGDPHKPFRRAGKGTVQRRPTLMLYKDELDELYSHAGDAVPGNELILPSYKGKDGK